MDFINLLSDEAKEELGLCRYPQSSDTSSKSSEKTDSLAYLIKKLDTLLEQYSAELKKIKYQRSLVSPFDWLPADEVIRLLNISRRTFFNWRDNGILRVSSVRGKLYCKRSDMEKLLADHYKKGATDNC